MNKNKKPSVYKLLPWYTNDAGIKKVNAVLGKLKLLTRSPVNNDLWYSLEFIYSDEQIHFKLTKMTDSIVSTTCKFNIGRKLLNNLIHIVTKAETSGLDESFGVMAVSNVDNNWISIQTAVDMSGNIFLMISTPTMEPSLFVLRTKEEDISKVTEYRECLQSISSMISKYNTKGVINE